MKDEKLIKQSKSVPVEAIHPKKAWQKPHIQQLRISLDTAFSMGSNTDGFGGASATPT